MNTLVKTISEKLIEFGLSNINNNTVVTVDDESKEVNVFDSESNSFKNENGQFIESFVAYNFIYQVSDDLLDLNYDEIRNDTCIIDYY